MTEITVFISNILGISNAISEGDGKIQYMYKCIKTPIFFFFYVTDILSQDHVQYSEHCIQNLEEACRLHTKFF